MTDGRDMIAIVRKRPGMYVGDTGDGRGVLHMLLELLANALDQHLAGRCSRAAIEIAADGTIEIGDDGPGLSAEGCEGLPPLHDMLTRLSNRPTVDGHRPHAHLGIGGMGLFVVNALSSRFELRSVRDGVRLTGVYSRGEIVDPVTSTPAREQSGTRIRFQPDPEIFSCSRVPRAELACHLEDLSFLVPRFTVSWAIGGDAVARGGLAARVAIGARCPLEFVATHSGTYPTASGPIDVEVAVGWVEQPVLWGAPAIESFVNLRRTRSHGSHVEGLLAGLRRFLGGRKSKRLTGLVAAVSVVLADVKYGKPDKSQLESREARDPVAAATGAALSEWARRHPDQIATLRGRLFEP